jgi:tripartite-type tricarboxylate transporter receptor subunit TctC
MNFGKFVHHVLWAIAGLTAVAAGPGLAAYPEKPVTIIVAWPAGGATDLLTRGIQDTFSKALGAQTVVKNVTGAAGTIGTAEAASATPDGHTILVSPIGPIVIQTQRMKLTYGVNSLEPVCKIADATVVMMSPPQSRFKSVADVIKEAKAQGGKLPFASTGPGTIPHLSGIGFQQAAGVKLKHVPYKGSADVVQAMLTGTIEVFSDQPNLVPQYNLTPLAVYSEKRLADFKDVPTMKELGFDLVFSIWNAMFAPKGTPEAALSRLESACKTTMGDPSVIATLAKQRQPLDFRDRKATAEFIAAEFKKAKALLEAARAEPK